MVVVSCPPRRNEEQMENEVRKVEMSENVADPTGLGLLGLAIVCFVVSTSRVGWSGPTTSVIIPWAVLLGSLAQLMASYFDFKKNNPFGSVVFGAMAGVWLIQMGSFGPEIQKGFDVTQLAFAFVGFLIFSIFGTIASLKTNKVVFAIMVLICFLFFGLATDLFLGGKTGFFALAAWSELFISLLGFYGSGAVLVNKVFGKTVFPMGKSIL